MKAWRALAVAASLALPVGLVAAMAGQAEWVLRGGTPVRVAITGYDPSDPIRGHYLRYQFDWEWEDDAPTLPVARLCVLSRSGLAIVRPLDPGEDCAVPVQLQPGRSHFLPVGVSDQLFIPEDKAKALQATLRDRPRALTIMLSVAADGSARVAAWQVDGVDIAAWQP